MNVVIHRITTPHQLVGLVFNFVVIACLLVPAAQVTAATASVMEALRKLQDEVDSHNAVLQRERAHGGGQTPRHTELESKGHVRMFSIHSLMLNAASEDMGFRTYFLPLSFSQ